MNNRKTGVCPKCKAIFVIDETTGLCIDCVNYPKQKGDITIHLPESYNKTLIIEEKERQRENLLAKDNRIYNELKRKCYRVYNHAIDHEIIKKNSCEICGQEEKVHGHHFDYTKPLEIAWLCPKHHGEVHTRINQSKETYPLNYK
jgi:hypothetical protein